MKRMKTIFFYLTLTTSLLLASCGPNRPASGMDAESESRVWFDAPLPNSTCVPPNPCQVVAHGSDLQGISSFELSANGNLVAEIPSPNTSNSLVTLTYEWHPPEPGIYILTLRAKNNPGKWIGYAETSVVVPGLVKTGQIGGAVFGDLNGNGVQDGDEDVLDGVEVFLKSCGADLSQVTGADGTFQFANVPSGTCMLEVSKAGWGFSGSSPNLGYPLPVASDPSLPTNVGILMAPMADNLPPTATFTPAPVEKAMVEIISISADKIFYRGNTCGPKDVTIQVRAKDPVGITVVVLFYQVSSKGGGGSTAFDSLAMNPIGEDLFQASLDPESSYGAASLSGYGESWLSVQAVIQNKAGDTVTRTPLRSDVTVAPCGGAPPAVPTTTLSLRLLPTPTNTPIVVR